MGKPKKYYAVARNLPIPSDLKIRKSYLLTMLWVLKLIRELDQISSKYFKKLVKTDDIWEVRVDVERNTFRLLGFFMVGS